MKITVLPVGIAPTHYSFNGDILTAYHNGLEESFDFSGLMLGGMFEGFEVDTLELAQESIIRSAFRDSSGELNVTLCQQASIAGHWEKGDEIDSSNYNPEDIHVILNNDKEYHGVLYVVTSVGELEVIQNGAG